MVELGPVNATIHKVDENVKIADLEELTLIYENCSGAVVNVNASGAQLTIEQLLGTDDGHLVQCGDNHRLTAATWVAFQAMQRHALEDGIDLQLVSSFRDFNRQLSIWNRKWQGALPLYDIDDRLLDTAKAV